MAVWGHALACWPGANSDVSVAPSPRRTSLVLLYQPPAPPAPSIPNFFNWTGVEKNLEIHGNVTGFSNTPINPPEISDNTALAHGNCVGKAGPKNDINITALIRRK